MGARLVTDLNSSGSSSPQSMVSIDGMLYFTADVDSEAEAGQNSSGLALLKSDGTAAGTKPLKTFQSINDLVDVDGELYFIADDGTGNRLWRSDGTARGTALIKDLYPGADPNFPQDLFEIDGVVFYGGIDSENNFPRVNGYELWRREGSGIGSKYFRNLIPDQVIDSTTSTQEDKPILDNNGNEVVLTTTTTTSIKVDETTNITTTTKTTEQEIYENSEIILLTDIETTQAPYNSGDLETTNTEETIGVDDEGEDTVTITTTTVSVDLPTQLTTTTEEVKISKITFDNSDIGYKIDTDDFGNDLTELVSRNTTQTATSSRDLETTETTRTTELVTEEQTTSYEVTVRSVTEDSFPGNFTEINGNLFFTALSDKFYTEQTLQDDSIVGGLELWFSDGTEGGTRPININTQTYSVREFDRDNNTYTLDEFNDSGFGFKTFSASSFPRELTQFGNKLVLVANDGISGFELWAVSSEGNNLRQVSNLTGGNTSSSPEDLTIVGDRLYFTANDGNGRKLWSTSSALEAPTLVAGGGNNPKHLSSISNKLYFSAESEFGRELWVANGNTANLVADINPGSGSSSPKSFTTLNHWVDQKIETHFYFSADDGERGVELWSLNLSNDNAKPKRAADIFSGPASSEPLNITNAEERLYFTADDGQSGRELWSLGASIQGPNISESDGISAINIEENQKKVYQFTSNSNVNWSLNGGVDSDLFKIKKQGNLIFREAHSFEDPQDLDRDNTYEVNIRATNNETGTPTDLMVNVIVTNVIEDGPGDGEIGGDDGSQNANDGPDISIFSTELIKNIYKGSKSSNPSGMIQLGEDSFFAAENSKKGNELWTSKGSKATTSLLKDINPGKNSSTPNGFTLFEDQLYFSANDGNAGAELWRTDGTSKGTTQVKDLRPGSESSSPSDFAVLNNKLIFGADDGNEGSELWGLSKGSDNPGLIRDINPDIGSAPEGLTNFKQKIYFSAEGAIYGRELWETDGTKNGTKLVFDINPGGFHGNPLDLTVHGKKLYFTAETYTGGRQLWSSDGSDSGTHKISPLGSQNIFSNIEELTSAREQLFFSADSNLASNNDNSEEQNVGRELWTMRENFDSISLVFDINSGSAGSNPTALTSIKDSLYFSADDGTHGEELWMSDGTTEGTVRLTDINKGSKNSSPRDISEGPDGIYFSAIKDKVGRELWRLADDNQSATRIVTAGKGKKKLRALDDSNDEFRFELADQFGKAKADRITGFSPDDGDKLALSTNAFPGLSEINLVTVSSKRQLKAQQTQPSNIIYFEAKGKLYFDQNEIKKGYGEEGGLFAILKGGPDLTESSFQII